jgi:hypothetical protein
VQQHGRYTKSGDIENVADLQKGHLFPSFVDRHRSHFIDPAFNGKEVLADSLYREHRKRPKTVRFSNNGRKRHTLLAGHHHEVEIRRVADLAELIPNRIEGFFPRASFPRE